MLQSNKNRAVALKYDTEHESAPVVVAKRIIDVAEKNGIPVYRDDSVASLMCMLEVGSSIPPELYEVVAGVYVSLLRSSKELRDKMLKGTNV